MSSGTRTMTATLSDGLIVIGVAFSLVLTIPAQGRVDPLNASYLIDTERVTLVEGRSDVEVSRGSATKAATVILGKPVSGDLNGDGKADAAMILVQNAGGSGTFYYVAAAISIPSGTKGTNAILLGDRIAVKNIQIRNGRIIVNYMERKTDEPFSARPSVGITRHVILEGTTLRPVR
jgi:hypothetical protein